MNIMTNFQTPMRLKIIKQQTMNCLKRGYRLKDPATMLSTQLWAELENRVLKLHLEIIEEEFSRKFRPKSMAWSVHVGHRLMHTNIPTNIGQIILGYAKHEISFKESQSSSRYNDGGFDEVDYNEQARENDDEYGQPVYDSDCCDSYLGADDIDYYDGGSYDN
jgi:hypothetical protein